MNDTQRWDAADDAGHGEVAAMLNDALGSRLADGAVDVAGLTEATRAGIGRAHRTRVATTVAAAVLVAAVPLGYATWLNQPGRGNAFVPAASTGTGAPTTSTATATTSTATESASSSPSPSTPLKQLPSTAPATPYPTGTARPLPRASGPLATQGTPPAPPPVHVAYDIPESVGLTSADAGRPIVTRFDSGQYPLLPTVMGQSCQDPSIKGATPISGRSWDYWEAGTKNPKFTVDVEITGWATGTGPARFTDLVNDTGLCRWLTPQKKASTTGMPGDEAWAVTDPRLVFGVAAGRAAIRVGDIIVGVEVYDPTGRTAAVTLAKRLAGVVVAKLEATGLPALTGH